MSERDFMPTTLTFPLYFWRAISDALKLAEGAECLGPIETDIIGRVYEFIDETCGESDE